jgi:hypothetical protein
MHKTMGMKPKIQWRSQEVGDVRNVECLLRKVAANEWSQPRKEVTLWKLLEMF